MTDLRYSTGTELIEFFYAKCWVDQDLLAKIVDEYIVSLSDNKLIELEDFLTNNFGDNFNGWLHSRQRTTGHRCCW